MATHRPGLAIVLLGALALGCVGGEEGPSNQEVAELSGKYALDAPPADVGTKLGADFDGKITLLGVKAPTSAKPGQKVKITLYWQVKQALGEDGWNLFTHILDGAGKRVLNIDNVGPLRQWKDTRQVLWPSAWKQGKVYVDEQEFTLPANIRTSKIQIVTGLWKGDKRMPIKSGPKDREQRALVTTLTTGVTGSAAPAPARIPSLRVMKLEEKGAITIDGKLEEEAWKKAANTGRFRDVSTGDANRTFPVNGSAKLLWDDENFYVAFDVKDAKVTGGFPADAKDPHLWTKDTVEIMIDPDGNGDNRDYYEIQINPQNLVFDSQFDSYNLPKGGPNGPFGHQDWSAELKSAVHISGTLDNDSDNDIGYVVEAAIPWKSFSKAKQSPPKPGDTWRINFYAMQNNGGVAWSAILRQGNFHKASRFGRVTFVDKAFKPRINVPKGKKGPITIPKIELPKPKTPPTPK